MEWGKGVKSRSGNAARKRGSEISTSGDLRESAQFYPAGQRGQKSLGQCSVRTRFCKLVSALHCRDIKHNLVVAGDVVVASDAVEVVGLTLLAANQLLCLHLKCGAGFHTNALLG